MITRQLFKTSEEELDFIFGNDDVGQEFDIDIADSDLVLDPKFMDLPVLQDFQDFDEPLTNLGPNPHDRFHLTSLPLQEKLNLPSPPPYSSDATDAKMNSKTAADAVSKRHSDNATDAPSLILGNNDAFQMFDIANSDLLLGSKFMDLPVLEEFQDVYFDRPLDNDCEPLTNLRPNLHDHFHRCLPPQDQWNLPSSPPSCSATPAAIWNSKTATDDSSKLNSNNATADSSKTFTKASDKLYGSPSCSVTPIVHPANSLPLPNRYFGKCKSAMEVPGLVGKPPSKRKRQSVSSGRTCCEGLDPTATSAKASEARIARRNRRCLRAKNQAINLIGGGDVSSIQRHAVADSAKSDPSLLSDFSRNFDPKLYVDVTFAHTFKILVEAGEAEKAAEAEHLLFKTESSSDIGKPDRTPSPQNMQKTKATKNMDNNHTTAQIPPPISPTNTNTAAIPTPACKHNKRRKSLPSGKDPESRKLRRLMRNPISAQASRDRCKKAIEDARRIKAVKENEIKALEKTVWEKTQHMMQLAKAIEIARDCLGPDKYAKVSTPAGCSPIDVALRNSMVVPTAHYLDRSSSP